MKKTNTNLLIFFTLISFTTLNAFANSINNPQCVNDPSQTITTTVVATIASDLIRTHNEFQTLRDKKILVVTMPNDQESYFKTLFTIKSRLNPFDETTYLIYMNEEISLCNPSYLAVEAIIAHELFHLLDYVALGPLGMIKLGITYGPVYERETDELTVKLGYADGLIAYRYWIYSVLPDQRAIDKKIKYYLTPEEIRALSEDIYWGLVPK